MELRDSHITRAVSSSDAMEALLARFSEIAAPGKGAPIILAALARLGTTACHWIDGELRIEISGDDAQSTVSVSTTLGAGFREKLFADTVLRVPLAEFSRGIKSAPKLIVPLEVKETGKRIVLSVTQEVRRTSLPPPMVTIDPESLMAVPQARHATQSRGALQRRAPCAPCAAEGRSEAPSEGVRAFASSSRVAIESGFRSTRTPVGTSSLPRSAVYMSAPTLMRRPSADASRSMEEAALAIEILVADDHVDTARPKLGHASARGGDRSDIPVVHAEQLGKHFSTVRVILDDQQSHSSSAPFVASRSMTRATAARRDAPCGNPAGSTTRRGATHLFRTANRPRAHIRAGAPHPSSHDALQLSRSSPCLNPEENRPFQRRW